MEAILNGMMGQNAESYDVNVVSDVTESLFANVGLGSDLVARNIQRGRDHGLPGYNEFREEAKLERLRFLGIGFRGIAKAFDFSQCHFRIDH